MEVYGLVRCEMNGWKFRWEEKEKRRRLGFYLSRGVVFYGIINYLCILLIADASPTGSAPIRSEFLNHE